MPDEMPAPELVVPPPSPPPPLDYSNGCPTCGRARVVLENGKPKKHRPARKIVTPQVDTKACTRIGLRLHVCDGQNVRPA